MAKSFLFLVLYALSAAADPITSTRTERKITATKALWKFPIVYKVDEAFEDTAKVYDGIKRWETDTCLQFVEYDKAPKPLTQPYLMMTRNTAGACNSYVGPYKQKKDGDEFYQIVNIADWCKINGVIHEVGHAIGFWHEQMRYDRDNFLLIPGGSSSTNYGVRKTWTYGVPYDMSSAMHYSGIYVYDPLKSQLTKSSLGLTHMDIYLANFAYNCTETYAAKCGVKADKWCKNYGVLQKDCSCKCAPGTSGTLCEKEDMPYDVAAHDLVFPDTVVKITEPGKIGTEGCKDKSSWCDYWKRQNYCKEKYVGYMESNCPVSCEVCDRSNSCGDKEADCREKAKSGLCKSSDADVKKKTLESCALSCNKCTSVVKKWEIEAPKCKSVKIDVPAAIRSSSNCEEEYILIGSAGAETYERFCGDTLSGKSKTIAGDKIRLVWASHRPMPFELTVSFVDDPTCKETRTDDIDLSSPPPPSFMDLWALSKRARGSMDSAVHHECGCQDCKVKITQGAKENNFDIEISNWAPRCPVKITTLPPRTMKMMLAGNYKGQYVVARSAAHRSGLKMSEGKMEEYFSSMVVLEHFTNELADKKYDTIKISAELGTSDCFKIIELKQGDEGKVDIPAATKTPDSCLYSFYALGSKPEVSVSSSDLIATSSSDYFFLYDYTIHQSNKVTFASNTEQAFVFLYRETKTASSITYKTAST